jgi:hypothetical protein
MNRTLLLPALAGLLLLGGRAWADDPVTTIELKLTVRAGTGDDPLIALWLENDEGDFVKTLQVFSKKKAYHKELLAWSFKAGAKEKPADVDAITGATIRWGQTRTLTLPVLQDGRNLLDGTYVLRLESRKDKGGHYRSLAIPLTKGYTGGKIEDKGYVGTVELTVKPAAAAPAK